MGVVVDVVLAVAAVTAAPGAVPELQLGISHICPSADTAFVIENFLFLNHPENDLSLRLRLSFLSA